MTKSTSAARGGLPPALQGLHRAARAGSAARATPLEVKGEIRRVGTLQPGSTPDLTVVIELVTGRSVPVRRT